MTSILAMSHTAGTLLTVAIIVFLVVVCGAFIITNDLDWFD